MKDLESGFRAKKWRVYWKAPKTSDTKTIRCGYGWCLFASFYTEEVATKVFETLMRNWNGKREFKLLAPGVSLDRRENAKNGVTVDG